MRRAVRINRNGVFLGKASHNLEGAISVQEINDFEQLDALMKQPVVRLSIEGFADGRALSIARQLRLRGFEGSVELVGDILPDQLPMAVAAGIDIVEISEDHGVRCYETQWQEKAREARFGYQRSLGGKEPPV